MDKATFDKIIKAANGRPLIAFGDNAILFNVNTEQCPISIQYIV